MDGDDPSNPSTDSIPRTLTSSTASQRRTNGFRASDNADGEGSTAKSGLYEVSSRGLLETDVRRDFVLASGPDLGKVIGDSYLTLMDEIVLLGLKDQQV